MPWVNINLCSQIIEAVDRRGEELNLCCRGSVGTVSVNIDYLSMNRRRQVFGRRRHGILFIGIQETHKV
jgi:hypothetical protein